MKRFISLLLTLILLVSSVTAITANAYILVDKGFIYELKENKYAMITDLTYDKEISLHKKDSVLEIPEEVDGYPVKYIRGSFCMSLDAESIKKLIIPDTVTYIGPGAFAFDSGDSWYDDISGIETIELSSNLTYIGARAFEFNTKLKEINIPDTVTYIGEGAFAFCKSLKEVYVPGTVVVMGERSVFACCDELEKVTIGEGMKGIPLWTFESCDKLKKVKLPESMKEIGEKAFDNCASLKSIKVKDNISIGKKAFGYYENEKGKEKCNENFKFKIFETESEKLDDIEPLYYAYCNNMKSVYYLKSTATSKIRCNLKHSSWKCVKTTLKIDGAKVVNWTSKDPKVAKITPTGKLKTVGKGMTVLTATLKDGTTYTRKLKVYK